MMAIRNVRWFLWQGVARCLILASVAALASPILALFQEGDGKSLPLGERVVEHTLENGWRFLLLPRAGAPTVSFETYVATGSGDDPEGFSGLAHHVKNLLFKGSSRLGTRNWEVEQTDLAAIDEAYAALQAARQTGRAQEISGATTNFSVARRRASQWVVSEEFSRILEDAGGGPSLNAYTDGDGTRFVVSLPSNQIETWCWMESERFRAPVFREFYTEREALLEDRRGRVETDVLSQLALDLRATAYGSHALGRPSLGSAESIQRIDRPAALEFFRERYGARNLTTAIVGNFDPERLIPQLEAYFASVPPGPDSLSAPPPIPEQDGERRVQVLSEGNPVVWIAWHVPPRAHADSTAVDIAVRLLGHARSSRLEKHLKRESALVTELALRPAWGADRRGSLAMIRAVPNLGVDVETVEAAIYEQISLLVKEGPDLEELAGVKRVATTDHIRSLRDNAAIARGLNEALIKTGDWRTFFNTDKRLAAVSAADIRRVLETWFVPERRTVAILVRGEQTK